MESQGRGEKQQQEALPRTGSSGGLRDLMDALTGRSSASHSPARTSASTTTTTASSGSGGSSPGPSSSGYLDFLIGDPAYRQAKAQLTRYRSALAAEAARAEAGFQRGARALRSFDAEARKDAEQLARTGGRHLAFFEYMAGLRVSLLRLEQAQWQRAARLLRAREQEVHRSLERLQELLAEAASDNGGPGRLDEAAHLRPTPQELLAGDAELRALQRRAGLLSRVCEGVGAEASLLVLQGNGGGGGGGGSGGGSGPGQGSGSGEAAGGCEGCGAGLEGPVESMEERRRKLQHLAEEAAVFYFGGGGGGGGGDPDGSGSEGAASPPAATAAAVASRESSEDSGLGMSPGGLQRQREREVVQLRLKCEREFAYLVADERHREGRLLARWLELLREVAGDEEEEDGQGNGKGGGGAPGNGSARGRERGERDRQLERSTGTAASGGSLSLSTSSASSAASSAGGLYPPCDAPIHAPRCIAAFIQYLAVKRLLEPYQLDESLKPALIGLTQALVFRRARRACFGYVKGGDGGGGGSSAMRRLNGLWRDKMLLVRRLSPQDLGVPPEYIPSAPCTSSSASASEEGTGGAGGGGEGAGGGGAQPYHETSRALGEMALCLTPQEMSDCLLTAVRVLHVEARLASQSQTFVDADTFFPVLLWALAQADVPDMYACLHCLAHYAAADYVGEKAYFITTLAAAVAHLQQLEVVEEEEEEEGKEEEEGEPGGGEGEGEGLSPTGRQQRQRQRRRTRLRVRPPPALARKDSAGGPADLAAVTTTTTSRGSNGTNNGGLGEGDGEGDGENGEDLLERYGPRFTAAETRRALAYLDGWLAMELNMEQTIEILERDGWW